MLREGRVEIGVGVLAIAVAAVLLAAGSLMFETGGLLRDVRIFLEDDSAVHPAGDAGRPVSALVERRFVRFLTTVLAGLMVLTVAALGLYLRHNLRRRRPVFGDSFAGEDPERAEGPAPDRIFEALERVRVLDDEETLSEEEIGPDGFDPDEVGNERSDLRVRDDADGGEAALIADSYNKMVEALQKVNDLEKRHSIELAAANQRLEREIAERERAEREIRHLSRKLMTGIEDAQKNLAQDLHDEFGQTLAALHMGVESLWKSIPAEMMDQKRSIAELIDLIEQLGDKIRSISSDLRPDLLDDLGLVPTLEWYLKEFGDRHPSIRVDFQAVGMKKRLPPESELVLYRIFQESLNNVVKHARARQVGVRLAYSHPKAILLVQDDGVGFAANQRTGGIGLIGMRERAVTMDGTLEVRSIPGKGTRIRVELPISYGPTS